MTITNLTIRQFLKSKSLVVVAIICLIPLIIAIIPHFLSEEPSIRSLRNSMGKAIFLNMYATLLIPIGAMVLSSTAFGDEIDDKTLYILALKPISRFRIVLEKFLAVIAVALPIVWAAIVIVWTMISWGRFDEMTDLIWPMLASSAVGVLGFGSIFLAFSLFIRRTLIFGMFYVTIWEGVLSNFLPGIRSFSIGHYTRSVFVNLVDDRNLVIDDPATTARVVITIGAITLISLAVGTWRLRRMAIE